MLKRPVAAALCITLLLQQIACYSTGRHEVAPSRLRSQTYERILGVTTKRGELVRFDLVGSPAVLRNDSIFATVRRAAYIVALTDVDRVWIERRQVSAGRTIGAVVGVTAGVVVVVAIIILATKESCPFIYSWDGSQYVFDAEPYGGAITEGLERDDYALLEHVRPVDGAYRLRLTNEVNEAQYTDLLELWVADHPPGTRVVPDEFGRLHTVRAPHRLTSAADGEGRDLRAWLETADHLVWEPPAIPGEGGAVRQDIVLTFPKPRDARTAKLVATVATGMWGSHMIRSMLELRGSAVGEWYAAIDGSPAARDSLMVWNLREELYALRIEVEEPTGWHVRGILPGGGPLISEERVVPLDVSHVTGTTLRIRIRPPRGFWALDAFAVSYEPDEPVGLTRVAASAATDHQGRDVSGRLRAADGTRYAMPVTGDWAELLFPAPPASPGLARSVFAHTRGYYRLNLPATGEPRSAVLQQLVNTPDAAARLAAEEYHVFRASRRR